MGTATQHPHLTSALHGFVRAYLRQFQRGIEPAAGDASLKIAVDVARAISESARDRDKQDRLCNELGEFVLGREADPQAIATVAVQDLLGRIERPSAPNIPAAPKPTEEEAPAAPAEAPKAEEPKAEEPKAEEAVKAEAPAAEAKAEAPAVEEKKAEAPAEVKAEAPVAEEKKAEEAPAAEAKAEPVAEEKTEEAPAEAKAEAPAAEPEPEAAEAPAADKAPEKAEGGRKRRGSRPGSH